MIESRPPGVLDEVPPPDSPADDGSMAELRSLLLGPAETQIAEIHARLTDPQRQLQEVVRTLPAAVAIRTRQNNELTEALSPSVTAAIDKSVRNNPQPLVDAIFPVMGPAIRKAIAVALGGMMQSLNQSLAYSFSVQGLKWRLEALRTGKTFAEVVLLHTLLYRVEQVFLIHKETGLLLQHVVAGGAEAQDADMVSSMLTAIQDFVRDSFSTDKGDALDTLQMGDLTVWIEQGPLAIIAGVIRGSAPQDLRDVFRETLEKIHFRFNRELKDFAGDAAPLTASRDLLDDCLQSQFDPKTQGVATKRRVTPLRVIALVVVAALLVWCFFAIRSSWRWQDYVERLKAEPGIVVTEAGKLRGKRFVSGLRDPLAPDPASLMGESRVEPTSVVSRWEPYYALTPDFVLARCRSLLQPPPTVSLRLNDGVLEVEGFAAHRWVTETRQSVHFIPGIRRLNDDNLLDLNRIEDPLLMFELDRTRLLPRQGEKLELLAADINRLRIIARRMNKSVRLEITGRTDASGTEARNLTLSQERANTIAAELKARLPQTDLTIVALGTKDKLRDEFTDTDRATNRSVTFRIVLLDS